MIEALLLVIALGVFLLLLIGVSRDGRDDGAKLGLLAYREARPVGETTKRRRPGKGGRHA